MYLVQVKSNVEQHQDQVAAEQKKEQKIEKLQKQLEDSRTKSQELWKTVQEKTHQVKQLVSKTRMANCSLLHNIPKQYKL